MSIDTPEFVALTEKIKNSPFNYTLLEEILAFLNNDFCEIDKVGVAINNIPFRFPSTYTLGAILQKKRNEIVAWLNNNVATIIYNGKPVKNYTYMIVAFIKSYNNKQTCISYFIAFMQGFIAIALEYSKRQNFNTCLDMHNNFWINIMFTIINQAIYSGEFVENQNYVLNTITNLLKYKNTFSDTIQFYKRHNIPHFLGLETSNISILYEHMITDGMDNEITELFQAYPTALDTLFEGSKQLNYLQLACKYNCPNFVDYLLSSASALTMVEHKSDIQYNAIHYAALQSETMLSKFLHFPEHFFNEVPPDNKTVLWHACYKNYTNILPTVIGKTSPEFHGIPASVIYANALYTPLMRCCVNGNFSAAMQLLDGGNSMVEYCCNRTGNALVHATNHMGSDNLCARMVHLIKSKEKDIKYYLNGVQNIMLDVSQKVKLYFSFEYEGNNKYNVNNNTGTILLNACKNKLHETVKIMFQEGFHIHTIFKLNMYKMDALCYCLLNKWDDEVESIIKFNMSSSTSIKQAFSSYISNIKTINNLHRNDKQHYTWLTACINSYIANQTKPKKDFLELRKTLLGRIITMLASETDEQINVNIPVYSALEAAEMNFEEALQSHNIIFLYQDRLYATTIEFLIKCITDINQLKHGCRRVIEDLSTFNADNDIVQNVYISLTLFGISSGVIGADIILDLCASGKRYFKLTEIAYQQPYFGMMSQAWLMGLQSASADHCQADPQGKPFFQQPYTVIPIKHTSNKRTMVQEETPVEKRVTPTLSIMINGTTYPLTVGLQNTLQELYDEIMTYKPDAVSFRIVFGGAVIRSGDLQANGNTQISEYTANNRKIFSGDNLKMQVMFTQQAPAGGSKKRKRRQQRRKRTVKSWGLKA